MTWLSSLASLSLKHGNLLIKWVESRRTSRFKWKEKHTSLIYIQKYHSHYMEPWTGADHRCLRAKQTASLLHTTTFALSTLEDGRVNVSYPPWSHWTAKCLSASVWAPKPIYVCRGMRAARSAKLHVLRTKKVRGI